MDNQSPVVGSSYTEPKGKRHRRSGNPSGQLTAQSTLPSEKTQPQKKDEWANEPPEERLAIANATLKACFVRLQSLGCEIGMQNMADGARIRITGMRFKAPGTEDSSLEVAGEQKPPAPAAQK